MICWKCKKEIDVSQVYRNSECVFCGADLHTCKGCDFYSPGSHYDCKENVDQLISDKEKANFCDFFRVKKCNSENNFENQDKTDAYTAAAKLFGDDSIKSNKTDAKSAKDAFNSLFN